MTEPKKKHIVREYAESLFLAVLFAFLIRSFLLEPYKIPSKSMLPTLLVGDHIFVNKFYYGFRIPGTKTWIKELKDPQRGEVIVFIYPEDESLDFIKRVVGVPGDRIRIAGGELFVNEQKVAQHDVTISTVDPTDKRRILISEAHAANLPEHFRSLPYYQGYEDFQVKLEKLDGLEHLMQRSFSMPNDEEVDLVVPDRHYFVMGDNRDQSADSRVWGFVPRENLKGEALFIWLSLDNDLGGIRYKRFGSEII